MVRVVRLRFGCVGPGAVSTRSARSPVGARTNGVDAARGPTQGWAVAPVAVVGVGDVGRSRDGAWVVARWGAWHSFATRFRWHGAVRC